ncbi:MAG: PEP-CTERM sorting domain-containing protein [Terriglobia bacterium]
MAQSKWYAIILFIMIAFTLPIAMFGDIIYNPGFTVMQSGNVTKPDVDCITKIDSTCRLGSGGRATLMAADGSQILVLKDSVDSSPYEISWAPTYDATLSLTGSVVGGVHGCCLYVNALQPGTSIGPQSQFISGPYDGYLVDFHSDPESSWNLVWIYGASSDGDILGVEFQDAQNMTHYGWVDITWSVAGYGGQGFPYAANLGIAGYGYEACPDAAIAAGAQSGGASCDDPIDPSSPVPEPGTMALLGTGLAALAGLELRRKLRVARSA